MGGTVPLLRISKKKLPGTDLNAEDAEVPAYIHLP